MGASNAPPQGSKNIDILSVFIAEPPAGEIFETTATADPSKLSNKVNSVTSAVCEASSTGTPTIDQAIIAAYIIKSYCQEVSKCSKEDICPLGHMINCYETEFCGFGPDSWDVPNPEEIGLSSNTEELGLSRDPE